MKIYLIGARNLNSRPALQARPTHSLVFSVLDKPLNKCMYTQKSPLVYQALLARLDGFDQASSLGKFPCPPASKHQGAKPKSNRFNPTNHREKRIYEFCTSKTEFLCPTNLAVFVGRMCPVCVPICLHVLVCQVHIDLG